MVVFVLAILLRRHCSCLSKVTNIFLFGLGIQFFLIGNINTRPRCTTSKTDVVQSAKSNETSQKKPISNLSKTDEPNAPCVDRSPLPQPLTSTKVNVVNCTLHSSLRNGNRGQTTAHTSFVQPSNLGLYSKVGDRYECMCRRSTLVSQSTNVVARLLFFVWPGFVLRWIIYVMNEKLVV